MKRINEKVLVVVIMILTYLILTTILSFSWWVSAYNLIINPACWIGMFLYCKYGINNEGSYRKSGDITKTVFFMTFLYLLAYFTSGLFTGYARNPLSLEFFTLIKNIWAFVIIIFFQEYVRAVMIKNCNGNKMLIIAITILFALVEINISALNNLSTPAETFKYVSKILLPVFARSFLFTYLVSIAGHKASTAYRIPVALAMVFLPILPDYDWFFTSITELLIAVVIYLYISYYYSLGDRRISRKQKQKNNPLNTVPAFVFLILMVAFVAGFLKYQPIAIVSNSMYPIYQRGDAVIIEHINKDNLKTLEKGNIIEYILEGKIITHRIVDISEDKDGKTQYITKGDNNNAPDTKPVYEEQIKGIVRWYVPKVGYPSVWFSEIIQ